MRDHWSSAWNRACPNNRSGESTWMPDGAVWFSSGMHLSLLERGQLRVYDESCGLASATLGSDAPRQPGQLVGTGSSAPVHASFWASVRLAIFCCTRSGSAPVQQHDSRLGAGPARHHHGGDRSGFGPLDRRPVATDRDGPRAGVRLGDVGLRGSRGFHLDWNVGSRTIALAGQAASGPTGPSPMA